MSQEGMRIEGHPATRILHPKDGVDHHHARTSRSPNLRSPRLVRIVVGQYLESDF